MNNAIIFDDSLTFESYITVRDGLQRNIDSASDMLKVFPRSACGLVSDEVRESAEYKCAKLSYDIAFRSLRNLNKIYVKKYRKELAQLRASKWKKG